MGGREGEWAEAEVCMLTPRVELDIDWRRLWQELELALYYARSAHFYARNSRGKAAELGVTSLDALLGTLYVVEDVLYEESFGGGGEAKDG